MPIFKSTKDIFVSPWNDEVFNENWMDSDKLILPQTKKWDYKREMQIENVDIWEQIYYQGGGLGVYAAWTPYAEFYMITHHLMSDIETFYGSMASHRCYKRAVELGIPIQLNEIWIEEDDIWLYKNQ